jgi:hypothetical protein
MYIAGNIIPATTNTYFLGDSTHRFANLWLGPGTIYLTDTVDPNRTTTLTATNRILQVDGAAGLQANLIAGNTAVTLLRDNNITLTAPTVTVTNDVVIGGNLTIAGNIAVNNALVDRGAAGSDWDTITQMGTYVVNRVSWSGTTGTPLDSMIYTGLLEVANSANTAITQNYRPYDAGTVASVFWTRSKFNASWSTWREIVNNSSQMDGGSY